jgi:hypothetical protein
MPLRSLVLGLAAAIAFVDLGVSELYDRSRDRSHDYRP